LDIVLDQMMYNSGLKLVNYSRTSTLHPDTWACFTHKLKP